MPVLPGHNYIGPGNELNAGEPIDSDDYIAQQHDSRYESARSVQEVREADSDAIHDFLLDSADNIHSAVGYFGLKAKSVIENLVGHQYPPLPKGPKGEMSGKERIDEYFPVASSSNKRQRGPDSQIDSPMSDEKITPQDGGGVPGGTGASQVATIIKNPRPQNYCNTYKKTWQLYTAGFQFERLANASCINHDWWYASTSWYSTPLAVLDPNFLPYFLNKYEFDQLALMSFAKSCRIKITPLGYRLPFATNEAASSYANAQTLVQLCHGIGLNKQVNIQVAGYSVDKDLTTPTGTVDVTADKMLDMLYGSGASIGAVMGVPRFLNQYTTVISRVGSGQNPNINQMINIENVNDVKGTPIIDYSYSFKNGMLKNCQSYSPVRAQLNADKTKNFVPLTGFEQHDNYCEGYGTWTQYPTEDNIIDLGYTSPVEKAYWFTRQKGQDLTSDFPPLVHFGCMPVQSNAALSPAATFADVVIQWKIECEMDVETSLTSIFPDDIYPYTSAYDPDFRYFALADCQFTGSANYCAGRRVTQSLHPKKLGQPVTKNHHKNTMIID